MNGYGFYIVAPADEGVGALNDRAIGLWRFALAHTAPDYQEVETFTDTPCDFVFEPVCRE